MTTARLIVNLWWIFDGVSDELPGWAEAILAPAVLEGHRQQQGFKTSRKPGLTLGNYQEARIRRVHMTLDEFMSAAGQTGSPRVLTGYGRPLSRASRTAK